MLIDEFDYELDESLIAQTPLKERDKSRLMVLDKETGEIEHRTFCDIIDYLEKGDTLVLNDTKVLPARLIGSKDKTGAVIEVLLLQNIENDTWECLVKPARRIKKGDQITFGDSLLVATCTEVKDEGIRIFNFAYEGIFLEVLDKLGTMPLPPYIHEKLEDKDRYQTVYAKEVGSAAAPTAGLHFTKELLEKVKEKGVNVVYITLHVGLGTFRPVKVERVEDHKMHSEYYRVDKETADLLNNTRKSGKRIIAVGTTSTRTLETLIKKYGEFREDSGFTDIFITPKDKIDSIDALITNFHLPKSTLVMLVSTLAGKDNILHAYKVAQEEKYRFFSFGDAMFIK
ncbi:MAG: tRNA preQ1(34) S-adenosylmethionine ribosyltransferase-isomerase QueA [Bacilli bacterium]|nr:tRNA preQ1(34) S-adenosylmethionine ribosyltransferase-isomerase QueA [Bacilli bacterium]